jgi:hypothetical protein
MNHPELGFGDPPERKHGMVWLEIINTRAAGIAEAGKVFGIYREMSQSVEDEKLLKLAVFCNARYPTDVSIHLHWKSDPGVKSVLGSEISSALEDLGLISHTLWIQKGEVNIGDASEASPKESATCVMKARS